MFEIKITDNFKNFREKLSGQKLIILDSKIAFLKSTGFLGNSRTIGNGIFEFNLNQINLKIYFLLDNINNTITFEEKSENLKNLENNLLNWNDIRSEKLKDFQFAKSFYNTIFSIFKDSNEPEFFNIEIKNLFQIQGAENFKKITGFDLKDFGKNKNIETLKELQEKINFSLIFENKESLSKKLKIELLELETILKCKENFNLKNINNMVKFYEKNSFKI